MERDNGELSGYLIARLVHHGSTLSPREALALLLMPKDTECPRVAALIEEVIRHRLADSGDTR